MRADDTVFDSSLDPAEQRIVWFGQQFRAIRSRVEEAVRGKGHVVDLSLVCMLAEGHLLIEDVPGVGKTTLARSLAAALDLKLTRIQFTPDLLPSDVTGVSVFNPKTGLFDFKPGPAFTNILLADEINRASAKTQSALLEVMEERQITVDGEPRDVKPPFLVVATQNSVELAGTYPLPEAQLDRFLIRLGVGYPSAEVEQELYDQVPTAHRGEELGAAASALVVQSMIGIAAEVRVGPEVLAYAHEIVVATRQHPSVRLGASPRGGIGLVRAARVRAAAEGRGYVLAEDIAALAAPVLGHRLMVEGEARVQGRGGVEIILEILDSAPAPVPDP